MKTGIKWWKKNPAPLYVNIGRWIESQEVQDVLLDPENGWDAKTRNLFTQPLSIQEDTVAQATKERVSTKMMMNALTAIKEDWPEVISNRTLVDKADELYREARTYNLAYGKITDIQLYYLESEIISGDTKGINNPFGSWLYYEKSLAGRYNDFLSMIPKVPDKRMDVYSNYNAVMSGQNDGAYRYLVSSTPMGPIVGDKFQKVENSFAMIHSHEAMASFCAPSLCNSQASYRPNFSAENAAGSLVSRAWSADVWAWAGRYVPSEGFWLSSTASRRWRSSTA